MKNPTGTNEVSYFGKQMSLNSESPQASHLLSHEQAIPRGADRTVFPLSFRQQRLWFLDQLEPGSLFSSGLQAFRLNGRLRVDVLQEAFNTVVSRHWSLHTTFATIGSETVQIISVDKSAHAQVKDLNQELAQKSEVEVLQQGVEMMQLPFDLSRGPLLKAGLVRLSERQHILLISTHPIISDRQSMRIFLKELFSSYETLLAGRPSLLAELSFQYVDFAVWQRQWLQSEASQGQLSYWKQQLQSTRGLLELPTDRPRPALQSFRGALHRTLLPKNLCNSVKDFSQREGVTVFVTYLAAFQVLLSRYTGEEDIVVGTSVEGRRQVEAQELIGPFVNRLALRTDLSGNPSFRELLRRVKEVTEGAWAHQDMPFEKLVEELQPERSLSHAPLFQVMFELQQDPQPTLELPDLTLSSLDLETGKAETDLTLSLVENPSGLMAFFEYNTDLFDATTIGRMAAQYQTLLQGAMTNPERRLADLPLLTDHPTTSNRRRME